MLPSMGGLGGGLGGTNSINQTGTAGPVGKTDAKDGNNSVSKQFIEKDNVQLQAKTEGLKKAAWVSIGLGVLVGCIAFAAGAVTGGLAAVGLLALGGALFLARHAMQKQAGVQTDFVNTFFAPLGACAEVAFALLS